MVTAASSDAPAADALPPTISVRGGQHPFWVSSIAATDEHGGIRWSAFDAGKRYMLESTIQRTEARAEARRKATGKTTTSRDEPCSDITLQLFEPRRPVPDRTWSDLATNAEAIFRGTIISASEGF